jgi:hypothetical protein
VLIVLIHCKVVRCEYKGERGNTYVLFNLERSHDSIFIESINSRMGVSKEWVFPISLLHQRFVRLCTSPWFIMTTFMFFSFDRIFVCECVLSWCMCVFYVYTWRSVIFSLFRMKTLTTLSFWSTKKIWILCFFDPLSGENN